MVSMEAFPQGESQRAFHSPACLFLTVKFADELGGSPVGELDFSFGARDEVFAASEFLPSDMEDSPGPHHQVWLCRLSLMLKWLLCLPGLP